MAIDTNEAFLLILVLLLLFRECFTVVDDTLSMGESLSALTVDRLSSQNDKFELGYFKRGTSSKIYLGIWYKGIEDKRIVWVANRENHLSDQYTARLEFSNDGNLVLLQASSKIPFWSTNLTHLPSNSIEAALLDDGNFVLRDRSNLSILWESFNHPTDTWLPGVKVGTNQLISWKNSEDPSPGVFSFGLDPNGVVQFILEWNNSHVYWSSEVFNNSYLFCKININLENETYINCPNLILSISSIGQIMGIGLQLGNESWTQPRSLSNVYALCGAFGIYNNNSSNPCDCPKGFEPFSDTETRLNDWSGGCLRKHPLQCENRIGQKDWFLKISNAILPVNSKAYSQLSARRSCKKWEVWVIVALPILVIVLILCLSVGFSSKGKLKCKGDVASSYDLLLFDFSTELHAINDKTNTKDNATKSGKKDVELPQFSYESVSAATNNFSNANKLGEGGFGPVYKGKSLNGQEIAVKILSKSSTQGLDEFMNETTLIAKLQHGNLVRLLGSCMEGDKKILIYEYMPNKSLDFYLFDPTKKTMLDWETRIHIINGIAQGLLYLHQYSRLRIIHRDMKPSNILLDGEMNPKISDFGMARIVGDNEAQANTNKVVGTYGYMSPEYVMEGLYSIKSDVFSFGVLLLEIVSGEKNTGFYNRESLNLLSHAWELWKDEQSLELMDSMIGRPSCESTIVRLINIGLLCVEESPSDRPTMFDVVSMMSNEHAHLPIPNQPAFTTCRNLMHSNPKINCAENCSINSVTISVMEAR
ncbi:receptor-like serine/threonine-protein kinase SD1-7 [Juglans microcarpa x Juglans regia]|uniref:receptor-like serine/threonine-protein kinase SD1-7 n=1 Tax=Juglans microcarpa x Juglans regia TaxID=2249226 RepID=UPI001B7F51E6|nr:receptor-like serine/threonine-protein kinase SD1-7 [Juglans microcarpa x Juglans regia]